VGNFNKKEFVMSEDLERMLRNALDDADRYRKRVLLGSVTLGAVVFALLFWIEHLSRTADLKAMLPFILATILAGQVTPAVITWGIVAQSTRKILKAIELLSMSR
jgi:hypothetical protein